VVITIDDGYKTAKEIAWPILQRYGFPFTLYVYTHAISRLPSALTWDDIRQMSEAGVDIESHSVTHPLLTHPHKPMIKKDYWSWIDQELIESKKRLENKLHKPVTSLAYPYGGYDEQIVEHTRAAGYKTALTCDDGDVSGFTDPLLLNRRLVFRQTSPKAFAHYFRALPLQVADLSPRDGERIKDLPSGIQARIADLHLIQPGSVQILVDKLGRKWRQVVVDPQTGAFNLDVPKASRRGYYFVSLVARDRLNPSIDREASWLFIVRKNISKKQ
jgi:hypothetical protein